MVVMNVSIPYNSIFFDRERKRDIFVTEGFGADRQSSSASTTLTRQELGTRGRVQKASYFILILKAYIGYIDHLCCL